LLSSTPKLWVLNCAWWSTHSGQNSRPEPKSPCRWPIQPERLSNCSSWSNANGISAGRMAVMSSCKIIPPSKEMARRLRAIGSLFDFPAVQDQEVQRIELTLASADAFGSVGQVGFPAALVCDDVQAGKAEDVHFVAIVRYKVHSGFDLIAVAVIPLSRHLHRM